MAAWRRRRDGERMGRGRGSVRTARDRGCSAESPLHVLCCDSLHFKMCAALHKQRPHGRCGAPMGRNGPFRIGAAIHIGTPPGNPAHDPILLSLGVLRCRSCAGILIKKALPPSGVTTGHPLSFSSPDTPPSPPPPPFFLHPYFLIQAAVCGGWRQSCVHYNSLGWVGQHSAGAEGAPYRLGGRPEQGEGGGKRMGRERGSDRYR
eukprot:scaffold24174_cov127-Isochrysis_galbana.AAC.2